MKESWAIGLPGQSLIGTRVRLVISSVSVPLKPGSTKPAVACTIRPSRPMELLPSILDTMSAGISTYSSVRPSTNSPGWITNGTSPSTTTSSVRFVGGSRRSIAAARWLWNTRKEPPSRRSTDAGWTIAGSHGSITTLPSATRRRIVPSERTDVGAGTRESYRSPVPADEVRWVSSRDRSVTVRTRGGEGGAGSPCGPRRGLRGSGPSGWWRRLRPPSPPPSSAESSVWWIAHQTSQQSASSGTFRQTNRKNIAHSIPRGSYPRSARGQAPTSREEPLEAAVGLQLGDAGVDLGALEPVEPLGSE